MAVTTAEAPKIRKLTLARAAAQYEETTRALKALEELQAEAKEVLVAYFDRTEKGSYRDRIGWEWTGGGLILDQPKVKEHLGARLAQFQKRARRTRRLTLLRRS